MAVETHAHSIRLWLYAVAALVAAMVLVGGATRLTESGLSITEWRPVIGVLPPLSEHDWLDAFEKYKAIPQYGAINPDMGVEQFKTIFWWEWTHRLLGRLIGVAFLVPFVWFLRRGWIAPPWRPRLWFIFALGGLQGAVGWWMVASGLADRIEVSQYRLATHLLLACVIYAALVWTASKFGGVGPAALPSADRVRSKEGGEGLRIGVSSLILLILVLAQVYLGALVAGLRAGYAYNTWPLIDGALIPSGAQLFHQTPLWRNFFEIILTVQFDHRMLAYTIFMAALLHAIDVARTVKDGAERVGAYALLAAVALQVALGIATLLLRVPLPVALLHQAMAMIVLTIATVHAANTRLRTGVKLASACASPLSPERAGQTN